MLLWISFGRQEIIPERQENGIGDRFLFEETVTRVMPHNSDSMLTNKWHHINSLMDQEKITKRKRNQNKGIGIRDWKGNGKNNNNL